MAGPVHTQFAMQALGLADLFKAIVGSEKVAAIEGPTFQVELSAPDGPSTGGGAQSVQHVALKRDGLTVVAGSVNSVEKAAELRSYAYASGLHAQRYKNAALPIDRTAYEEMLKRVRAFCAQQGFTIVLKDAAPVVAPPEKSGANMGMMIAALLIIVGIGAAAYLLVIER